MEYRVQKSKMLNIPEIISSKFLYILFKLIVCVSMYINTVTYFFFPAATCTCYFRIFLQKLDRSVEIRSIVHTFLFSDVRNVCSSV